MQDIPKRRATYAELEAVPPHLVAEIIGGELVTHPRPAPRQASTAAALTDELVGPFQKGRGGPGGWVFMIEPELHLGDEIVVPDFAGWRRERLPALPETAWIETAPDWVCEILSPPTAKHDRTSKRIICARFAVQHLWHVDPVPRLLEAFGLRGGQWRIAGTFSDQQAVSAPPFTDISFSLGLLWPFEVPSQT
jgi:Uma2 family endonuclease